jgi:5-methylcytosine-specific restriction protein B
MESLLEIIKEPYDPDTWPNKSNEAFENLFGSTIGRYAKRARNEVRFRTPKFNSGSKSVPFSAIIHESNPDSGGYGGMSFVIFPVSKAPPMIAMVVGTQGLSPDEHIIGKPGHTRKINAICKWLNTESKNDKQVAWAKREAVRTDISVPNNVRKEYPEYKEIFDRYGDVIYGFSAAKEDILESALKVFLDFHFQERGHSTLSAFEDEAKKLQTSYFNHLMPTTKRDDLMQLLQDRKFVILQGPPGTGKTRLANTLLKEDYDNRGSAIQFHPNTTYETFIGGLFPRTTESDLGLQFQVKRGQLLDTVVKAQNTDEDVLLVIDEINRADLSKVLGEAIYSLEPHENRTIELPYDFGEPINNTMSIPPNLHILGTMNTADRSISILDVAIRRRFAFVDMWPQSEIVEKYGNEITKPAFQKLLGIFIEYAPNESFALMPGHSYFIAHKDVDAAIQMKTNLIPLLNEYLNQGYVSNFADAIHAYIQEIEQL